MLSSVKKYKFFFILIIAISIIWALTYGRLALQKNSGFSQLISDSTTPMLTNDINLRQTVNTKCNQVKEIQFIAGTFARSNQSNLFLQIKSGEKTKEQKLNANDLINNINFTVTFDSPLEIENDKMEINISNNADIENSIVLYTAKDNVIIDGDLYINNEKSNLDLAMQFSCF